MEAATLLYGIIAFIVMISNSTIENNRITRVVYLTFIRHGKLIALTIL